MNNAFAPRPRDVVAADPPSIWRNDGILYDPYVHKAPPPPPERALAPAAIAATLLAALPIGSIAAIFVGIRGLSQTKLGTLRGRGLAIGAIVAGVIFTLGYGAAGAYYGKAYYVDVESREARKERKWERKQREREADERNTTGKDPQAGVAGSTPSPSGGPPGVSTGPAPLPPSGAVPQQTTSANVGAIPVVEIGVKERSLQAALMREVKAAKDAGKQALVMTTRSSCVPCNGFMTSLPDPKMQEALSEIRLIRVDVEVFREDLEKLHFETAILAGFFLLTPDGQPRDGINGGEWDADIPQNIAPVMKPFVRGEYKTRKHPFPKRPQAGTFL